MYSTMNQATSVVIAFEWGSPIWAGVRILCLLSELWAGSPRAVVQRRTVKKPTYWQWESSHPCPVCRRTGGHKPGLWRESLELESGLPVQGPTRLTKGNSNGTRSSARFPLYNQVELWTPLPRG
ncbi:hypothetical protein AAHC03_016655 [Spirometra sp. Aus1]